MDAYYAPVLCMLGAWAIQLRRNRTLDRAVLALVCLVIMLMAGLRWYSDVDFPLYVEMYHDNFTWDTVSLDAILSLYGEPGYLFVTAFFKSLDTGFGWLALTAAVTAVTLKGVMLSQFARHGALAFCLYLCVHFQTNEFIQMRWAIATGWISVGFLCQFHKKYWYAALCFALALGVHYFSVVFIVLALMIPRIKHDRTLYLMFVLSLVTAFVFRNDFIAPYLVNDSQLYLMGRINRYATNFGNPLGAFSYLKLFMYVVVYTACVRMRPTYAWKDDALNTFLFRVAFLSICLTLALTFQPVMHYRATVVADLFSAILITNAIGITFEQRTRALAFAVLVALFGTWYLLDLRNNFAGYRLYEYRTWVTS